MKKKDIPKVVITDLSNRISYIQWFVYGFMLLSQEHKIRLKFKLPLVQRMYLISWLSFPQRVINKIKKTIVGYAEIKTKAYLKGYIETQSGRRSFCIDSADSPNMFSGNLLKNIDCYFKLQCPKSIDTSGFKLGDVNLPYFDSEFENPADIGKLKGKRKLCPEVIAYKHKIKPLMVAVRSMGVSCSFKNLHSSYQKLLESRKVRKTGEAMCYFGNACGPVPTENVKDPDFDWEADIMGYFGKKIHHPNEKRAHIAKIISSLGDGYDARIINNGNSDASSSNAKKDLIIPLKEFSAYVAKFQYNVNISGYRMSIPARFIDSFICGTAIATDNLAVKWYHPFGKEVYEFGEMGYLPENRINYKNIENKLRSLPTVNKTDIITTYEKYWSPEAAASYMINTVIDSKF